MQANAQLEMQEHPKFETVTTYDFVKEFSSVNIFENNIDLSFTSHNLLQTQR